MTAPGCAARPGRPTRCAAYLERFEEAGVDQVIFVLQAGRNRHEHICESLELFGAEVLPAFKERDEAQVRAKAARLAPAVDAAMERRAREPGPPRCPRTTRFPPCRGAGRTRRAARRCGAGSSTSPTRRPRGSGRKVWASWGAEPPRPAARPGPAG